LISIICWHKSSFDFAKRGVLFKTKPNVPLVRLAEITHLFNLSFSGACESLRLFIFKNVRWEKIKI